MMLERGLGGKRTGDRSILRGQTARPPCLLVSYYPHSPRPHPCPMPYLRDAPHGLETRLWSCGRASFHWGRARDSGHAGAGHGGSGVDLNGRHGCGCVRWWWLSIRLEHRHMPIGKRIARCHSGATHASGSQGQDEGPETARLKQRRSLPRTAE